MNHRDAELQKWKTGLTASRKAGRWRTSRRDMNGKGGAKVVAGVPLAIEPGGIAADRAAEPAVAISRRSLMLMRSFAIPNP